MTELIRADLLLTERELAVSRTAAQNLIADGRVWLIQSGQRLPVSKPSQKVLADAIIEVDSDPSDRYVSRGGLKLAGALAQTGLDVRAWHCLDVGISTGGFSDCLLQAGASKIVGVDVGHGQLHPKL
ncbi:SAM-dependent methyltransferase, partial [Chitinimonas sp.]|uniref:SAM-dependent methyltransferase n=1 Tax=Chitinimonas sp. TaxID=1934313 RepID=UPI0035B104FE